MPFVPCNGKHRSSPIVDTADTFSAKKETFKFCYLTRLNKRKAARLTDSLIYGWLNHWLTDRPTDRLKKWMTDWLTNKPTVRLTDKLSVWVYEWLTNLLADWVTNRFSEVLCTHLQTQVSDIWTFSKRDVPEARVVTKCCHTLVLNVTPGQIQWHEGGEGTQQFYPGVRHVLAIAKTSIHKIVTPRN